MSDSKYDRTIDWDQFWSDADPAEREHQAPAAHHATDVVAEFLAETGAPDAFADVGCGPGTIAFEVADAYPDADVVGYDAAEPVLAENRERARERDVDVRFERAVLPAFEPDRQFDVVFSYFTLCYVADVETALENLYDAVAPGGSLVFNYQNRLARSHWRWLAEDPEERVQEASAFDPETFERRFELLLQGENLLSYERIQETLGTWPRSVWRVVDKPDVRWAWRHHPVVFVPK
jgi:trans-aconitate methyltransferase